MFVKNSVACNIREHYQQQQHSSLKGKQLSIADCCPLLYFAAVHFQENFKLKKQLSLCFICQMPSHRGLEIFFP